MPSSDNNYILQYLRQNAEEDARLDQQHIYLKALTNDGKLLAPEILDVNGLPGSIADLGCGTGVFLNDVARDYYAAMEADLPADVPRLVGFDVNEHRFVKRREPGVELYVHDCTTPFPSEWLGQFDVVNIRVLWAALKKDDVLLLIRQALSLLRPGGYLQWLESEFDNIKTTPPSAEFRETLAYLHNERATRGLMTQIPTTMMQTLLDVRDETKVDIQSFETISTKRAKAYKAMGKEAITGYNNQMFSAMKVATGGIINRLEQSEDEESRKDLARLREYNAFFTDATTRPGHWDIEAEVSLLLARKEA